MKTRTLSGYSELCYVLITPGIIPSDDADELPEEIAPRCSESTATNRPTASKPQQAKFYQREHNKLDKLMDLVGEIITTESMVTKIE